MEQNTFQLKYFDKEVVAVIHESVEEDDRCFALISFEPDHFKWPKKIYGVSPEQAQELAERFLNEISDSPLFAER